MALAFFKEKVPVKVIAERLGRSRDVVRRFLADPERYGTNFTSGRPPKASLRDRRRLCREASNTGSSSVDLVNRLGLGVSPRTARRYLVRSENFKYTRRKKVPMLTQRHKEARLEFAKTMVDMGEKWRSVVFTDEKRFSLDGPDACQYYWHDLRHEPETFFSRQNGGGSVLVWAGFSAMGTTEIDIVDGNMDSARYIWTLSEFLLPFAHRQYGLDFILQQDNARPHVSRETVQFQQSMLIEVLKWPACSPDLNPMENLWAWLARQVYRDGRQYTSKRALEEAVRKEWKKVDLSLCTSLVLSMKNRCIEVIERRGAKTQY